MGGVIGVAGLFFSLTGASELVLAVTAIGVLSCFLAAALVLLSRADLGLQRL
jgi:hypothetical protein